MTPAPRGIVCVTGANGFIGRATVGRLLDAGYRVRGIVRRALPPVAPTAPADKYEQTEVPDVGPETDWSATLTGADAVIHLAARVHRMDESGDAAEDAFARVNASGTGRLAAQAAEHGVRRMVFMSTVKVLGEGGPRVYTDNDQPNPQDAYARSKHDGEMLLMDTAQGTKLSAIILRPPLVYGPGVGANFLRLMKGIERGIPFPFGSVDNQRSLIYVHNLADALVASLGPSQGTGTAYLVSDGLSFSTPHLIRAIADALNTRAYLTRMPPFLLRALARLVGKGATMDRLIGSLTVDSSRFCNDFQWSPPFSPQEGLTATAAWYAAHTTRAGGAGHGV